ncbi:MerR family transcriptional regulator [Glycomyces tenuis]|uniref:MerR family transcriptional regulator n=1 Tax=Glycomyces tenuis TaxID=58116 RepID=UPI000413E50F|nr:MerR family transcriptional regulator [Glycomyces tenuis]
MPIKSLRHYAGTGLVYTLGRSTGGYRLFDEDALWCLRWIATRRGLGLTIAEIREIARTHERGPISPRLAERLAAVRERTAERIALIDHGRLIAEGTPTEEDTRTVTADTPDDESDDREPLAPEELTAKPAGANIRAPLTRKSGHAAAASLVLTGRNLRRLVRVPTLVAFTTIQPVLFVVLFTSVFDGATDRDTQAQLPAPARLRHHSARNCLVHRRQVGSAEGSGSGLICAVRRCWFVWR